jgi:hypothetical protein
LTSTGALRQAGCGRSAPSLKPADQRVGAPMIGIVSIIVFIAVIAALNFYEFGRFD